METLNIVAASPESAHALMDALSEFDAELIRATGGGYEVMVTLGRSGQKTVAVLNALERFVTERERSARLTLGGHEYVMHPDSGA